MPPAAALVFAPLLETLAAAPYGGYLSWWKALLFAVVFFTWIRLMIWMDKDSVTARMPREAINGGVWALLVAGLVAALLLPTFVIAFSAFAVLFVVSVVAYLIWRNSVVGLDDIPAQLKGWAKNVFKSKKARRVEHKDDVVAEGMLTLYDKRGTTPPVPAQDDPTRPAYETAHRMLLDPLYKGAERIVLANAGNRFATKFRVDGFDYPGMAVEPEPAALTIDYFKNLAGLEVGERRKLQTGKIKAKTAIGALDLEIQTSGTRTGESLQIEIDRSKRYRNRASALGMTQAQRDVLAETVEDNNGIVLAAAPVGGGLSALLYGLVQEHDAFVQHLITLERPIERELEGVTQNTLPAGVEAGEERKQVSWIADQMPDVFMATQLDSRDASREAIRLATEERRRVYLGVRANDTADALGKWRALVADPKAALARLVLVIAGRSMRKLCDACKVPYTPGDQVLAKMGVPKGKVQELFKARTEPMLDQRGNPMPCEFCGQLGYKGRIGAFEMLHVDAEAKQALAKDASASAVRTLLRSQKMPTLNEAALRLVIAGHTDLQEVQRVMTPATPAAGATPPAARRPAPTPPPTPAAGR